MDDLPRRALRFLGICAAERESAYVIDGLMRNDVVKSDIHSTDTHGYLNSVLRHISAGERKHVSKYVNFSNGYKLIHYSPKLTNFRDTLLAKWLH